MSIKTKLGPITRFVGRTGFRMKKNAPTVLTIVGVGALIAAGVMAVRATPDMEPVSKRLEVQLTDLEKDIAGRSSVHPDDAHADMVAKLTIWKFFCIDTVKVYGPAVAVGAVGVASILYGHGLMRRREASLIAAYGVLERAYTAYRDRVRESFGEKLEKDLYEGKVVTRVDIDQSSGVVTYDTKTSDAKKDYVYEFGPSNKHWNMARAEWNLVFLRNQQKYANDLLNARGHLFLNEVLDSLGFEHTKAGAVTGWTRNGGDGFVTFFLPQAGSPEEQDYFYFFNGEVPLLVEFNVDGLIYDKI